MSADTPRYLTTPEELLFRQVHPTAFHGATLTSSAFTPGSHDDGLLSVHRERLGAEAAYALWASRGGRSAGTYAITVSEINGIGLKVIDDATPTDPDHASIDFTAHTRGEKRQLGRKLRDLAVTRGRLYPP